MEIIYTRKAKQDLVELRDYYADLSHLALQRIVTDIIEAVEEIPDSLSKGRSTPHPDVWEKISPKYNYILPYFVRSKELYILRIYHPRRYPLDYQSIVDTSS